MGLIENQPNAYSLYESDGWKMCSVIPIAEDTYNLGNYAGMHFQKVFNGNVTKEELNKLKRKYKLYRKEELQQQTTIDDYLF
ncbi:hypothetical protein [Staphylococcus capitis]|uniref:hypothetical protein n=1 Tax=Staphylococcus capitis TaxID=29388 RepID=UPI000E695274|nr:hypothetical protein [Staphylococcus capitis]RIM52304.1 hypothetical protein BU610_07170 [Staphylococcus capitis]